VVSGGRVQLKFDQDIESQSMICEETLGLNQSQLEAYISALTQEFAVIQGNREMRKKKKVFLCLLIG